MGRRTFIGVLAIALAACLAFPLAAFAVDAPSFSLGHAPKIKKVSAFTHQGTAAAVARLAYPTGVQSKTAVVISDDQQTSELGICAVALAGAIDCPLLYTNEQAVPAATLVALRQLGVEKTVIVGDTSSVSNTVREQLISCGQSVTRIWGKSDVATQLAVYRYGDERGLWDSTTAFIVPASLDPDIVSLAPVAFKLKIPVIIVPGSGILTPEQVVQLEDSGIYKFIIAGGENEFSASMAERLQAIADAHAPDGKGIIERMWDETPGNVSAAISQWAVGHDYLKWSNSAFAGYYSLLDALSASVLQGKTFGALLLVDGEDDSAVYEAVANQGIGNVRIVGDDDAVPVDTREAIADALGFYAAEIDGYQTRYIPDISHWNYMRDIDEFMANVEFVIMKCTQGAGGTSWSVDSMYNSWVRHFNNAGVPHWDYTFMERGDGSTLYGIQQAQFLMNNSIGATGFVLDVEDYAGARPTPEQVEAAARYIVSKGYKCIIYYSRTYTNDYGWVAQLDDLRDYCSNWCAAYGANDGTVSTWASSPSDLHQYTSRGYMPGIWGNCDLSVFLGMDKPLSWFKER